MSLCLAIVALSACSGEGPSDDTGSLEADASGDVETHDTLNTDSVDVRDTRDTGGDEEERDVVDANSDADADIEWFNEERILRRSNSLQNDFEIIDDTYAIATAYIYGDTIDGERQPGRYSSYLLNIADPQNVYLVEHILDEPSARATTTAIGGRVVRARTGSDTWQELAEVTSYELSEDGFTPLDTLEVNFPDDESCKLTNIVSNSEKIALLCVGTIIELSIDDEGRLEEVGRLTDLALDRHSTPEYDRYEMTPDGLVLQTDDDVRLWHLPSTLPSDDSESGDEESPSPLVGSLSDEDCSMSLGVYDSTREWLYFSGHGNNPPAPGCIIDISERSSPAVVGRWSVRDDLGRAVAGCRTGDVANNRLYLACTLFHTGRSPGGVWTLDTSAAPDKLQPVTAMSPSDLPAGFEPEQAFVHNDYLYYSYREPADGLEAPRVAIQGVPLDYFETPAD